MASLIFRSSALALVRRACIALTLPTSRGSTRTTCRVIRICLYCWDSEGDGCKLTGLCLHLESDWRQEPAASLLFLALLLWAHLLRVPRLYASRHLSRYTA